jgi:endonuclease/exonuclease/phosphatase (EEP) superfamily protein YafD
MLNRFLPHCYTADDELRELGQAAKISLGPEFNVLVWNILKAKRFNWIRDFKELVVDKDLVLLQEAVLNAPSDYLFQNDERMQWVMARSFRHRATQVEHGVKTGCVVAASDRHFYLSPHTEPLSQTQKLLLSTQYRIGESADQLLVINMHALNFVGVKKYMDQLDQLDCALAGHTGPIILAGDFNTWNPGRLGHFLQVAERASLREAYMQRQSRLAHMNQHLDHVFYRGLSLKSIESLNQYRSSDHAPIVVRFSVAEDD